MPRFVILHHLLPAGHDRGTHFDLMLETGGVLRTWSLAELPTMGKAVPAESLPDHRLAYLTYEGPVSGDRGSVSRVEEGEFEVMAESGELLHVRLAGRVFRGNLELRREENSLAAWTASFQPG
jgi:hypothetical protein